MNKSMILAVLLASAAISLLSSLNLFTSTPTSTSTSTYTPASWPTAWVPVAGTDSPIVQDADDIPGANSGYVDLYYSDTPHTASAYVAYENNTCYFRLQLQEDPGTGTAVKNATWIAQIKNLSTGVVGSVLLNGRDKKITITRITTPTSSDDIYDVQKQATNYANAVSSIAVWPQPTLNSVPNSAGNYFLDFQVPFSALNGGTTQLGITSTTPIQLFFGTSMAATHTGVINKDWMIGGSVNWGSVDTTTFVTIGNGPLPVELTSFQAFLKNDVAELNWNTATETNNFGFYVLRSIDGKSWKDIGFVPGAGNSQVPLKYKFEDDRLPQNAETFYYRLRQMDRDGTIEYSPITMVHNSIAGGVMITDAYPNPFNPTTTASFTLDNACPVRLNLVDMKGTIVKVMLDNTQMEAGSHAVTVDAGSLPSGKYLLVLQTPDQLSVYSVMLAK